MHEIGDENGIKIVAFTTERQNVVQKGPKGHFRVDLCSEKVPQSGPFSDILTSFCGVRFRSLFECGSDVHSAHFVTQDGSEKWCEICLETQLVECSILLLFITLHDCGFPK